MRIHFLFYGIILLVLGQYVVKDFNIIRNGRPFFILKNINLSYDKKMEMVVDKIPYDFAIFIKSNTPENSTILIPPQGFPWDKTGNIVYFRYFLYPRKLINGGEKDPGVNINDVDYVLIDYGETNMFQYGFTNIWPKFNVNSEYITYWNPFDGTVKKIENGKYIYDPDNKADVWGIIKVKK